MTQTTFAPITNEPIQVATFTKQEMTLLLPVWVTVSDLEVAIADNIRKELYPYLASELRRIADEIAPAGTGTKPSRPPSVRMVADKGVGTW